MLGDAFLTRTGERSMRWKLFASIVLGLFYAVAASGQEAKIPANTPIGQVELKPTDTIDFPTLTWGGDIAEIRANLGKRTLHESFNGRQGVKQQLVNGDDFPGQVDRYLRGKTPFLRGELGMFGAASEVLNKDPRTKPVLMYIMTYSAGGDCFIAKQPIKSINDLKPINGKKMRVALQRFGPHMNLLNIILTDAKMSWNDIEVVWCKDLTGAKSQGDHPGARLRRGECDACFVISPDRNGLTGGEKSTGNGKEETVLGAKQILSTLTLNRGVADVFAVRQDFFDKYPDYCKKVAAGFIRGTYDLMEGQKDYDGKNTETTAAKGYIAAITSAQKYFPDGSIPEVTTDGVGMVHDAEFMGIPGNVSFFNDRGNLRNFERMQGEVLDLANTLGFAQKRVGFATAGWDWREIATLAGVKYLEANPNKARIAENIDLLPGDESKYSFTVPFKPDEFEFNTDTYGDVLDDCIKLAASYHNGVILVRGKSDVSKTLFDTVVALREAGKIKESGNGNAKKYYFANGNELDLTQTTELVKLINETTFEGFPRQISIRGKLVNVDSPKDDVNAMDLLSRKRAEGFRKAIIKRAADTHVNLDPSQIQITGVGIREPLIPRPKNPEEAIKNMIVQIQVRDVGGEALSSDLFNP
jgi:hypothetical protein